MNIIAVDIGNTNVAVGLFLDGREESIQSLPGRAKEDLRDCLVSAWASGTP